jgi:hypothetical protein
MGVTRKPSNHTEGIASGVTDVSNVDGSLTISPTSGDVVASLNVGNANTWTADQTFTDNTKLIFGTGGDAEIYYDGTDFIIDCRAVGTGNLVFNRGIRPKVQNVYTFGTDSVRWNDYYTDACRSTTYRAGASNLLGVSGSIDTTTMGGTSLFTNGILTAFNKH